METKHSKGEWYLPHFAKETTTCDCGYIFCGEHDPVVIATVHYNNGNGSIQNNEYPPKEEAIANAKLICATHDLLKALMVFVDKYNAHDNCNIYEMGFVNDDFIKAKQAIKKATE